MLEVVRSHQKLLPNVTNITKYIYIFFVEKGTVDKLFKNSPTFGDPQSSFTCA
jgi:hypothetical protein